jgi:hypothetical protein
MRRDLYAVLVTSSNSITPRAVGDDTHSLVSDVVTRLILVNNHPMTPEDIREDLKPVATDLSRYEVWSWDAQCIPLQARVGQIPKSGVFFIIEVSLISEHEGGLHGLLLLLKKALSDDGGPRKFQSHLAGPWAQWSPRPLSTFDVLLSASAADDTVAVDIEARLNAVGLSTVRSIRPAGDFGDETLRRQLRQCLVLLSVLTPSSVHDPRVGIETGACWVLAKPFVPVLSNITKTQLPPSMAARQCVEAGDAAALGRLPEQIKLLVHGR